MAALACEVFNELMHREPVDLSGDPVVALGEYLTDYARRLNDPVYIAVLVALIEGSARGGAFADIHERVFAQSRSRASEVVRRAQAAAMVDPDREVAQCVEDLLAPFLYRRLVTRQRITSGQVQALVDDLVARWA